MGATHAVTPAYFPLFARLSTLPANATVSPAILTRQLKQLVPIQYQWYQAQLRTQAIQTAVSEVAATPGYMFTDQEVAAINTYLENNPPNEERLNENPVVAGVVDFFFGDFLTLADPEASLGEKALATTFILVKPAKVGEVIYDLSKARKVKTGGKGNSKWKSAELLDELESSGIKYNPDEVMAITKTANGKLVWLEKGNSNAGFEHVMRHADEFAVKGIKSNEIPDLLMEALTKGKVVGTQGRRNSRPIYEVVFNGQKQRVAITVGNNGFIVGANPKSLP
ncbi:hypothetical protein [Shouchella clausii]|uniref:hypothetical protein n=1 Tax=Shouchella clausii TaxID=79880 RepID=UPI0002EBC94B|nr:hypothetical protein [Shouchella clausii]